MVCFVFCAVAVLVVTVVVGANTRQVGDYETRTIVIALVWEVACVLAMIPPAAGGQNTPP